MHKKDASCKTQFFPDKALQVYETGAFRAIYIPTKAMIPLKKKKY